MLNSDFTEEADTDPIDGGLEIDVSNIRMDMAVVYSKSRSV